jgi:hypothetical protein
VSSSNNRQWNDNHNCINPSQDENLNWDADKLILQGDAVYDYERIPAVWSGFDEQPTIYQYGDAATEMQSIDRNQRSSKQ